MDSGDRSPGFPLISSMKKILLSLSLTVLLHVTLLAHMQTVVVMPFANLSKNQNVRWISESFAELLQERLKWANLNLMGREERLIAFDRLGIPYSNTLSKASSIKIAQELDADFLVLGDFDFDGQRLQASASVLDLRKSILSHPLREEGPLKSLQVLCSQMSWQILRTLDATFPLSRDLFVSRFPEIPNLALESYIRGLLETERTRQIRFLRQADKVYPNYSKAIFQLGKIFHQERDYSTSSLWLQKLIRQNNEFLEAGFLLGLNYLFLKNYEKAGIEFQKLCRSLPLNEVYNNLGIALSCLGKDQEAADALLKAVERDPSAVDYNFNLAYHLWKKGNFEAAAKVLKEIVEREDDGEAHYLLFKCLRSLGEFTEANAAWVRARLYAPKVETWEERKQIPDLFRIQTSFDESSFRQLQLDIREAENQKQGSMVSTDPPNLRQTGASSLPGPQRLPGKVSVFLAT